MTSQLTLRQSKMDLKALQPEIGTTVTVQFQIPKKSYKLKLLGYKPDGSVILSAPRTAINPMSLEGVRLTAKLMAGNRLCVFASRLLKCQPSPFAHWHIAYPEQIEYQRVREYPRIPVNLAVSVDHQDENLSIKHGLPRILYAHDISLSGISVDATETLGQLGEKFFITVRVKVSDIEHVLLLPVVLRNMEAAELGVTQHGFEYESLEEDSKILLTAFVYQQFLLELGYLADE